MKQLLSTFIFLQIVTFSNLTFSQVSGSIFEKGKLTEQKDNTTFVRGFSNVQVKAYEATASGKQELLSQTQTDNKGNYFLNIPEGKSVKICKIDQLYRK